MKNNVIISSVVASLIVAGAVGLSASADDIVDGNIDKVFKKGGFERGLLDFSERGNEFKKGKIGFMKGLTDEEKTALESMSDEEKTEFFEIKKTERTAEREAKKTERQAHNNVIDKLLAGETLTAEEEALRAEIIELRAERKANMEARETEREEIKEIMEKKKAGEELTDEDEAKLDEMKEKKGGKKGKKRGNR